MSAEKQEDGKVGPLSEKVEYIFTNPNCGDKRKTHTVREWLEPFGLPVEDLSVVEQDNVRVINVCS